MCSAGHWIFIWDLFVKNASNCDHLENRDSKAGSQIKLPYKNILNFRLNPHGIWYILSIVCGLLCFLVAWNRKGRPQMGRSQSPWGLILEIWSLCPRWLAIIFLSSQFLTARYGWETWYCWCNTLFQVHSSLVKWGIYFGWMWIFLHLLSLISFLMNCSCELVMIT